MKISYLIVLMISLSTLFTTIPLQAQNEGPKESIAIVAIDTKGLKLDNIAMGNLVRLELEKTKRYEVLDRYDVDFLLKKNNIIPEESFGKSRSVEMGKILGADKILTGSAEVLGDKIIFVLRLIDVSNSKIVKTSVMEYIYEEQHIQRMTRLSINDLLGIENEREVVEVLVNFDKPITSDKASVRLNGPRFGMQVYTGDIANRLAAPKSEGGFEAYAFSSVFAYQHEFQYLSAGNFQALFEIIGSINGIETGQAIPALTIMNGMRFQGWEIGFGPAFRFTKTARGYYDEAGKWNMANEIPLGTDYELESTLDSRGDIKISTGLVFAVGKTFTSGYLNFPLNIFYSPTPQLDSHAFGVMLGFTIAKKKR